jgi:hypothetical protein
MSYKIVAIKKLKITMRIPSLLFLGAKFSKNTKNFLRLINELQNCCHQEVEEFYCLARSSYGWLPVWKNTTKNLSTKNNNVLDIYPIFHIVSKP